MSKDDVNAEVNGLQVSNSTFSASPPGSLLRAENCVMPQKGVVQPRRGQQRAYTLPSASQIPFALTEFLDTPIANAGTSKSDTNYDLVQLGTGAYAGGPYNPVDCDGVNETYGRMKFGQAGGYLHFCTTAGPKVLERPAVDDPRAAGLLRMPDPLVFMDTAASMGAEGEGLAYGESRAYRAVLRRPTSGGASLLSPPSGRMVITNRLLAPVGAMTRTGGNLVTVTFPHNNAVQIGLQNGDAFTLDPGEADFPAGAYTVASVTNNVITYASVGANVSNTVAQDFDTGPRPVIVEPFFSSDVATTTPVRVYRSVDTTTASPSDEMFLVAERFPDAGEVAAGFMVFTDIAPEAVINDPLYTNPLTGEGARQENSAPPLYRDLANFAGSEWYAQTTELESLDLQLLGVGSPDGVQNNDTLTIDGEVFTFKTAAANLGEVQLVTSGTPSFNIQQTTYNLISQIQQVMDAAGTPIAAYYNSAQNDAPGKVLLQATSHEQGPFAVRASRVASWVPALATATDVYSVGEYAPNGLADSKPGQPEAAPSINRRRVGSSNYRIERIFGLQQALLVFKAGDGIYALTGSAPLYNVQQISTANIIAPDAACVFADAVWVYTDQGILRVSDSGGSAVVSRPIETELNRLRALFPEESHDYAFAVPYENERCVMFFVPVDFHVGDGPDLPLLSAYSYNAATQAWTGPLYEECFSGLASLNADKLLLGTYDYTWSTSRVSIERKGSSPEYLDYADADFSVNIDTVAQDSKGVTVVQLASTTDVEAGDGITQGQWRTKIRRLRTDLGGATSRWVEPYEAIPWVTGACTIFKHYDVTLQFQPQGAPASRKTLTRLAWLFRPDWFATYSGKTLLMTDQIQANSEISTTSLGFGSTPFGQGPFGNPTAQVVDVNPIKPQWTNAAQFFLGFQLSEAWPRFKLQGFSMRLETADAPAGRGK